MERESAEPDAALLVELLEERDELLRRLRALQRGPFAGG